MIKSISQANNNSNHKYLYGVYAGVTGGCGIIGGVGGYNNYKKAERRFNLSRDTYQNTQSSEKAKELKNQIKEQTANLVERIKNGKETAMNNCIMIISKNEKYAERVSDWIGENSGAKYIKTDVTKDEILDTLENAASSTSEKEWNFIYAKNMETLIDRSKSSNSTVESMKDIMSATAEDYQSTLIFSTKNPTTLDKEAMQPHRVRAKFNIDEVTPKDFFADDFTKNCQSRINKFSQKVSKNKLITIGVLSGTALGILVSAITNTIIGRKNDTTNSSNKPN